MTDYRFDGRWVVVAHVQTGQRYTVHCDVRWLPNMKRYKVEFLLTLPGLDREEMVSRTHIRRWLDDRQAKYVGTPHRLTIH